MSRPIDDAITVRTTAAADQKLSDLRRLYEPYINGLSERLLMPLPPWAAVAPTVDNWRTSAWERVFGGYCRISEGRLMIIRGSP